MNNAEAEQDVHCEGHQDWPDVAQHLVDDFPDVPLTVIVREVHEARGATETASVEHPDALVVGEAIARHHLRLASGRTADSARLDPERHPPRKDS